MTAAVSLDRESVFYTILHMNPGGTESRIFAGGNVERCAAGSPSSNMKG